MDPSGKKVGNGFSKYIVTDLLRNRYGYNGVVCTDWGITHDYSSIEEADGKCWGVEALSIPQRHYEALKAGVDQFGGNNDKGPVLEAYRMWTAEFGEKSARERFERSAIRLLLNIFRTGLFENPYVDPDRTEATVGNPEFMQAGYEAQLRSVVLLKNRAGTLPASTRRSVYLPECGQSRLPVDTSLVKQYYELAESPENADFAIVFIDEPDGGCGYDAADREKGGNGYVPISLQYGDYTARHARPRVLPAGTRKNRPSTGVTAGKPSGVPTGKS